MKFASPKLKKKKILVTIDDFKGGSNSLMDEARMPSHFAYQATNLMQVADSVWKTRWGTADYGATHDGNIDGAQEYVASDGTTELVTIADGKAWKSTDGGSLTEITGATFTAGIQCYFMQIAGYLYIANGTDSLARYDGSSLTTYSELSAPENLSASLTGSAISSGSFTYYAEVTALNEVGETTGSTEASITCDKQRDYWTDGYEITWTWDAVASATRYQLYISDESGDAVLLTSVPADVTEFADNGSLDLNPYIEPPLQNTTTAPKFKSMCVSGNRIWATNDPDAPYTAYFSGTGQFMGNFSDFYGGGWINLEKGGRETPVAVKHYQSGTGDGRPTILCKTPDGHGAVWQMKIESATVGDTSFSVPSGTKVVGSFGTESILGVVGTDNDIAFPNRKGWFTLGPEKNYYGILRTRERSSNIRPYWRSLWSSEVPNIAAYFYDSKIFISVPTSSNGNDRIIVNDTERGNWAVDWSIGAKQFLEYTDSSDRTHLLCVPLSGTKLFEISENIMNDQGTEFYQAYISPLIPVSKDTTDVLSHEESILELGSPRGSIDFSLLGIKKDDSVSTLASRTITNFGASTGIGSDQYGDFYATSTNDNASGGEDEWAVYFTSTPKTYTLSTTKATINKRAKIYALQFKVSSNTADTDFTILKLQAKGTLISRRSPSSWRS